ncbi:hypothetical protein [Erythrobacter sp. YT30]|uniref:hypothetical protein n=1 Tax=Erythrobacter sp. YT30 TaxID=1735012 RepID=UPI00076C3FA7|nr:hypothetical protein [Erythrobacter sp. YT30]KWV91005.1 hypothetical protein AUC45_06655 [Erythrobacter sp. YT30]
MSMRAALCGLLALAAPIFAAAPVSAQSTTNFSMIGFDVDLSDADSYHAAISDVVANCEMHELDGGNAACVQQKDNGGQVWVGLRIDGDDATIITANPAFVGKSRFPATVEGRVSDKEWEPFEYQLAVTFSDLEIPLIVELADPREAANFPKDGPRRDVVLDLTAFVFAPQIYSSAEDFLKAQASRKAELQLASDFFIPSGLFGEITHSRASFAGKVIEAELMTTEDEVSHWRTLVEVQGGGTINVVFDDNAVDTPPKRGNVIVGDYWLSARVIGK